MPVKIGVPDRRRHRAELEPLIEAVTARETRAHWLAKCEAAGIPAGPICMTSGWSSVPHVESAGIVIAAIDGPCTGPALEHALAADIRLASDTATFSADGVADLAACGRRLARLLGEARAKEIVLGGRTFDALTARRLGLVTRVVPAAALGDTVRTLADRLAALPPLALPAVRDAVRATRDGTPDAALAIEHQHFRRLIVTRDHRAAVEAFLARRTPVFTGE